MEATMRVTIIGAGRMGRGIGTRMVVGGNQVELIDTDPAEARALADELNRQGGGKASAGGRGGAIGGEVVVLAIPYGAVADVVAEYRDQLAGRVVVDITNPVDFATFEGLVPSPDRSAGEEAAGLLPARTLVAGEVAGQKLDVLIAGDDQAAKDKVAALVEAGGLRAIDVGPLRRARQLEQLGFLHMSLQDRLGTNFGSAIKLLW